MQGRKEIVNQTPQWNQQAPKSSRVWRVPYGGSRTGERSKWKHAEKAKNNGLQSLARVNGSVFWKRSDPIQSYLQGFRYP